MHKEELFDEHAPCRIEEVVDSLVRSIEAAEKNETYRQVRSGFIDYDEVTGGFCKGGLTLIGGRPSMGTTAFLLSVTRDLVLKQGRGVLYLTLDLSKGQIAERLLGVNSKIPLVNLKRRRVKASELRAAGAQFEGKEVYIADAHVLSVDQICELCGSLAAKSAIDVIVIDSIHHLHGSSRAEACSINVARKLKDLAVTTNAHIIVRIRLVWDEREREEQRQDQRPVLSDIGRYGLWLPYLDTVTLMYRDEVYDPDSRDRRIVEVIVAFSRLFTSGTIRLGFDHTTCCITDFYELDFLS